MNLVCTYYNHHVLPKYCEVLKYWSTEVLWSIISPLHNIISALFSVSAFLASWWWFCFFFTSSYSSNRLALDPLLLFWTDYVEFTYTCTMTPGTRTSKFRSLYDTYFCNIYKYIIWSYHMICTIPDIIWYTTTRNVQYLLVFYCCVVLVWNQHDEVHSSLDVYHTCTKYGVQMLPFSLFVYCCTAVKECGPSTAAVHTSNHTRTG